MKYKKYVDESYVIWSNAPDEEIDVHFNEWYSQTKCFLDIGVRVCNIERTERLFIYLPLNLQENDFTDLFNQFDDKWVSCQLNKLRSDFVQKKIFDDSEKVVRNTACALFNANCDIIRGIDITLLRNEAPQEVLQNIVKIKHGTRIDYIVKMTKEICKFVKDINGQDGTLLEIKCEKFKDLISVDKNEMDNGFEKGLYVRFRVPHPSLQRKNLKKGVAIGTLIDAPSSNTLIQYMQRVNELRALPYFIREKYKDNIENQYIGKVMFMLAASKKYEIDDGACFKIRQFEYNLHKMYMPDGLVKDKNKDSIIIYQWNAVNRKPKKERTSSVIFKIIIKRDKLIVKDLLRYVAVGLVSSLVSILFSWIFTQLLP